MPPNPKATKKVRDTLTKDGWRYDGEKDFWTHPKRQGHIKVTIQGWVHKVTVSVAAGGCDESDIKARDDYRTVKEGFSETDLQEHLNSLESLPQDMPFHRFNKTWTGRDFLWYLVRPWKWKFIFSK